MYRNSKLQEGLDITSMMNYEEHTTMMEVIDGGAWIQLRRCVNGGDSSGDGACGLRAAPGTADGNSDGLRG